jgi:hypothetical protein
VLVDASATVRPEAMRRLRELLTDGVRAPLYGDGSELARGTARALAIAFVLQAGAHHPHATRRAAPGPHMPRDRNGSGPVATRPRRTPFV